ncbi:tetratricopeptide repeat protein [Kordia jejudonensis]|uniref:tetratricopeptide repeat protein n=1 Tax=Kordia jejudonensis TaxID=1348245 RepID=UPI000629C1F1|nr:tetratricopeptide repeat protein [Kordia jejudonensis]
MEKLLKLSLSFCCLCLLFSCGNDAANKRQRAEKRYKEAIRFTQGTTAFQNGIAEAVAIDSTYEDAVYELSVAHLKRGMPHKWLPQYNKALALNPEYRYPWRGYLYLWFYRDYKKAIADFDASDSLTPNFIDAPQGHSVDFWRGIAYLGLNDHKNSIAYFDKHIQKETEETGEDWVEHEAFLYRGIAHYEAGNQEEALKNFNTLLKYNSDFADAKYYKALLLRDTLEKLQQEIEMAGSRYGSTLHTKIPREKFQEKKQEALLLIDEAIDNFNNGYSNQRPYVETLRQLYGEDYINLKTKLEAMY